MWDRGAPRVTEPPTTSTTQLILNAGGQVGDALFVDDTADASPNTLTLTGSTIDGIFGTGGSIAYGNFTDVTVSLGTGGNVANVLSTHIGRTTVNAGEQSDIVNVGSDTQSLADQTGTLSPIAGPLTVNGQGGNDSLNLDDGGSTLDSHGTVTAQSVTGFNMADAGVAYAGFESFAIVLGRRQGQLYVDGTGTGAVNIFTGDGDDTVNIGGVDGVTTVWGGRGNDVLRANYDENGLQTNANRIAARLYLQGGADSDRYDVGLAGTGSARISVSDTADDGVNELNVYGTDRNDVFLSRPHALSAIQVDPVTGLPVEGGGVERVDYDDSLLGGGMYVYGRRGDDTFVFDDNSMPMTVYGDAGNDTFQIGQVFESPRDGSNPNNGLNPEDYFPTIPVTTGSGFLSNGVSFPTTIYGGDGDDSFTIYRNNAELFLFGEADDDTFRQRAFVKTDPNDPKRPFTNINGGQGADFIEYVVNEPVNVEGGDGFDTINILGTEFGDDFLVSKDAIYGAGLPTRFDGIEKVTLDGLEGNDTFFIDSTKDNVVVEIVGGRGSDTFNVAGGNDGQPITVVASANQGGHSGLIDHLIDVQSAADYRGIAAPDISAIIADNEAPGVVITPVNAVMSVIEGAVATVPFGTISYTVALTRPPEEDVWVSVALGKLKEEDEAAGGKGIAVRDKDGNPVRTLLFTPDNWSISQEVFVTAPEDTLAEGTRTITIQHSVRQGADAGDGGDYDKLKVASVLVNVIDNDTAQVVANPTDGSTRVFERTGVDSSTRVGDEYTLRLTKEPALDKTVTVLVKVEPDDNGLLQAQVQKPGDTEPADTTIVTFDAGNWETGVPITVFAKSDTFHRGNPLRSHLADHHQSDCGLPERDR